MVKILVFELDGDYGCFKKFYTTSSVLTYDFPPKTSVSGLICAILGIKRRSEDIKKLKALKIGIQLIKPVSKVHQGVNWLNTKVKGSVKEEYETYFNVLSEDCPKNLYGFVGVNEHKPSSLQLLKDPIFRIYVSEEGIEDIYQDLKEAIVEQCYYFTPYLGQSEFLCSVKYIDEVNSNEGELSSESKILVQSVIPQDLLVKADDKYEIEITSETEVIVEQMPHYYDDDYITHFNKFIYDKAAKPLKIRVKKHYQIKSEKIIESLNIVLF